MRPWPLAAAVTGPHVPPSLTAHLDALTGPLPDGHGLVLSGRSGRGIGRAWDQLVTAANVDAAATRLAELAATTDVYVSCTATDETTFAKIRGRSSGARGGTAEACSVVALWCDIDVAGPGHAAANLPPDLDAARKVVADLPAPSMVVATGGGLHCWWILDRPVLVDDSNRTDVERFTRGWADLVADRAEQVGGWHIDRGVGDLARILRPAGTRNHKLPGEPRRVTLDVEAMTFGPGLVDGRPWRPEPVHDPADLERFLAGHAPPAPAKPTPAARPAHTRGAGAGLDILECVDGAPWAELWPDGWSFAGYGTVRGEIVERWRRPDATSPHSAVCWPDGGVAVFSSQVPGLAPGGYSKAEILAWKLGVPDLSTLARRIIAEARTGVAR